MAADFDLDQLSYLEPKRKRWYTLEGVHFPPDNPEPVQLEMQHAGRSNAAFTSAMLKLRHEAGQSDDTASALEAADERQAKLFARTVITGWRNVLGKDGKPLPFSAVSVEKLWMAIAVKFHRPDIVGRAVAFAADADNFRDAPTTTAEELGKE